MNDLMQLIKPFKTMSEACIALHVILRYESLSIAAIILKKYFKKMMNLNELANFHGRAIALTNFFPIDFIRNYEDNINFIEKCCNEAKILFLRCDQLSCHECGEILLNGNISKTNGHLYNYSKQSQACIINCITCRTCSCKHFLSYSVGSNG
jgi:hypothetical protein